MITSFVRPALLSLILMLASFMTMGQVSGSKVYLTNGEYYEGQIVAISADNILLRSGGVNIISIDRSKVLYVFKTKSINTPAMTMTGPSDAPERIPYKYLGAHGRKYFSEIEGALTFASPFAVKFGFMEWRNFNEHWSVGLGTSMQFFRFSMMMLDGSVRRYFTGTERRKAFVDARGGVSYYVGMTQMNGWFWYPYQFSPVTQVGAGAGFLFDTGMGLGFTTRMGFSGLWYTLTENYTPDYKVEGDYFIGSVTISGSIVF